MAQVAGVCVLVLAIVVAPYKCRSVGSVELLLFCTSTSLYTVGRSESLVRMWKTFKGALCRVCALVYPDSKPGCLGYTRTTRVITRAYPQKRVPYTS